MLKNSSTEPIVISGAGIAGLCLALYFAKYGVASIILEKADQLKEIGAGLQLSPNATRLLAHINVLAPCLESAVQPSYIKLIDATRQQTIVDLAVKKYTEKHKLAPYITMRRADLQAVLLNEAKKRSLIEIKYDHELCSYQKQDADKLVIKTKQVEITTRHLICADGVWSNLRKKQPFHSGYIAWRATLPADQLPLSKENIHVFMSSDSHVVCYPISSQKNYNLVMVTKTKPNVNLLKAIAIDTEINWQPWPIFTMPSTLYHNNDNVFFIGDASHSLPPFAAQGAAMAIEDAASLATYLCTKPQFSLKNYAKKRAARIRKVKRRGQINAYAYHAKGPLAVLRNLTMRRFGGEKLLENLNWLYKYDALKL